MSQKAGDVTTYFSYYSAGNLIGMSAGRERYFYTRNAQNDITGLIDENGVSVVQYQYDSWGKLLGITGSLASTIGVETRSATGDTTTTMRRECTTCKAGIMTRRSRGLFVRII